MKARTTLVLLLVLIPGAVLFSQDNIQQRMIGYHTVNIEMHAYNSGYLFNSDSARFYYSGSRVLFENPFETYLRLAVDTLEEYLNATVGDYNELYHYNYLYDAKGTYYEEDDENFAFDKAILYSGYDEWSPEFEFINEFDGDKIISETNYAFEFEEYHFESEYNNAGRLVKYIRFDTWVTPMDTESVILFSYIEGKIASQTKLYYYNNDGVISIDTGFVYEYTYNDNGELIEKLTYYDNEPYGKVDLFYSDGKIAQYDVYDFDGGVFHPIYSYQLQYESGKLKTVYIDNEYVSEYSLFCNFSYNNNGRLDSISRYTYNYGQRLEWFESFDYDDAGRLSFYYEDGDIYYHGEDKYFDYDYNDKGQIIAITEYNYDYEWGYYANDVTFTWSDEGNMATRSFNQIADTGSKGEIFDELNEINAGTREPYYITYFYYEPVVENPAGSISGNLNIHVYPSPADNEIHVVVANADDDGIVRIRITDIEGQLVFESQYQSDMNFDETIGCRNFHPGIYFVTASIGGNTSVQKIVVR